MRECRDTNAWTLIWAVFTLILGHRSRIHVKTCMIQLPLDDKLKTVIMYMKLIYDSESDMKEICERTSKLDENISKVYERICSLRERIN